MNKEERKLLIKLCRRKIRLEIITRFWSLKQIMSVFRHGEAFDRKLGTENEIMKLLYGTDNLVEIGLKTGLLKKHPEKTKKRESEKRAEEIKDFFGGKSKTNKKRRSKK